MEAWCLDKDKRCLDIVPQSYEYQCLTLSDNSCVFMKTALPMQLRSPGRLALGVSVEGDRYVGTDNQITTLGVTIWVAIFFICEARLK